MAKKKAFRKVKSGFSGGGNFYETVLPTPRRITKIRCDGCGRDDSLKISNRQDDGNHYMRCTVCDRQPMLKEAKKAFKRRPEVEIVEAAGRNASFVYREGSRNPNHRRAYEGFRNRCALAADRAAEEIKRLKKALRFFTEGGCYDGWSAKRLMEEYDSHGT